MNIVAIHNTNLENTFFEFKNYFEALLSKESAIYAKIRNKVDWLVTTDTHPLDYPLCIYTTDKVVFCIADVAIGPPTSASLRMLEILRYLGFEVKENQIITSRTKDVSLDLIKENVTLDDEFKEYFELDDLDI